jgi:predicted metal-dependent hydrolase
MALDWNKGELAKGLRCYRNAGFFAAHEHWEAVWLVAQEPEKTFLQAVIQIAAAFHHLQRKNIRGTASLLQSAIRRLRDYPDAFCGIDVAGLRTGVALWLEALDRGRDLTQLPFPQIWICRFSMKRNATENDFHIRQK